MQHAPTSTRPRCGADWCSIEDEDSEHVHTSEATHVPVIRAMKPALTPPSIDVYVEQILDGHLWQAPTINVDGDGAMTPDQALALIVALANQLAKLESSRGSRDGWSCTPWCQTSDEQHAEEAVMQTGGAIHWSRHFDGDGEALDVIVAASVDEAGVMGPQYPLIHVGSYEVDASRARALALDLLVASGLVDIGAATAKRR